MTVRLAAGLLLGIWLAGGLLLTLLPADPAPGQIVEHNFIPLRTVAKYLGNLDSAFWVGQMVGNLLLLLPFGLLGPVAFPLAGPMGARPGRFPCAQRCDRGRSALDS